MKVLHIDSSAVSSIEASKTRMLSQEVVDTIKKTSAHDDAVEVTYRDVAAAADDDDAGITVSTTTPSFVHGQWVQSTFTPADARTDEQKATLAESDKLVDELIDADVVVIGMPIYNFMVPASLKAWVDQVCRVGRTFQYTPTGPVGLLDGTKRVVLVTASGGTPIGSSIDFATPYMRHIMKFLGLTNVEIVGAEKGDVDTARSQIVTALTNLKLVTPTTTTTTTTDAAIVDEKKDDDDLVNNDKELTVVG